MTSEEFEQRLEEISSEGDRVVGAAKKRAEKSNHIQEELGRAVLSLKQHYERQIQELMNEFLNVGNE